MYECNYPGDESEEFVQSYINVQTEEAIGGMKNDQCISLLLIFPH